MTETKRDLTERDGQGRFTPGNTAAVGHKNHRAAAAQRYKEAVLRAVDENELEAVVKALLEKAKKGDVSAAKEILDRCCGRVRLQDESDDRVEYRMIGPKLDHLTA